MRTIARTLTVAVVLACALPAGASAQTYWQVANGNWDTDAYWSAGEPTVGASAYINNGGRCNLVYAGEQCYDLNIGSGAGESGLLVIYNSGELAASDSERIGIHGTGTVTHVAGANTMPGGLHLGFYVGSSGTYSLSGTGSVSAGSVSVGAAGAGELSIAGGTSVSCGSGMMAWADPLSSGLVTVDGAGSTWDLLFDLHIGGFAGAAGTGLLTIDNGGLVDVGGTLKVWDAGTVNVTSGTLRANAVELVGGGDLNTAGTTTLDFDTATVTGAGSSWTHSSTLKIDTHTTGPDSVAVSDGGALSSLFGFVGYNTGHTGSVTVDDLDSTWDVTNNMTVGYYGTGTLTLTNEAIVNCDSLDIGRKSSGNGTVTVGALYPDDFAELHVAGNVNIGPEGTGLLAIVDKNTVEAGGKVTVGATGTLAIDRWAALWADDFELLPGATLVEGGSLYVNKLTGFGSAINMPNTSIGFGYLDGPSAASHSVGAGQTFHCRDLYVGCRFSKAGEFRVENGGDVTLSGSCEVDENGTLIVDGIGSTLVASPGPINFRVWHGSFHVTGGGQATIDGQVGVGGAGTKVGDVLVDGSGSRLTADSFSLGYNAILGPGSLTVSNGGVVEWDADKMLEVSAGGVLAVGNGTLQGGDIDVDWTGTMTTTGGTTMDVNSVAVDGSGTSWTHAGTLQIDTNLGVPSLSITALALVDVNGTLEIGPGGAVALNGGVLQADTVNDPGTGTMAFTAGRLSVGTYQGNLHNQGGTAAPGLSPGTMTVTGDYTQAPGGALEIEIAGTGAGQWDVLAVTGTANLDGTLDVVLDGYTPAAGDSFEVLTCGSRSGEFATITGWEDGGLAHLAIYGSNDLTLHCTWFGDATLDGCVDGLDYVAWSNNYLTGDTWQKGDFNGDLTTDGLDYVIWSNNYWSGCPEAPGSVPEPAAGLLLILGICGLKRRRA